MMKPQKRMSLKWLFTIVLIGAASLGFAWMYYAPSMKDQLPAGKMKKNNPDIDEKARKLLLEMDKSLKGLKQFRFVSNGYFESVDSLGRKERLHNSGELLVKRPDKIKVMRTGEKSDIEFYCDGKDITLYGKGMNLYATALAKSSLDQTFDNINENLDIQLPAMDLLYTDVYDGLMQNVLSGKYMGKEKIGNSNCDHLSFTGKEVDWEIWIEEGSQKLPRKYVIRSKEIKGMPEASIEITRWDTDVKLTDQQFRFTPPQEP